MSDTCVRNSLLSCTRTNVKSDTGFCVPKLIKLGSLLTELYKKITRGWRFLGRCVVPVPINVQLSNMDQYEVMCRRSSHWRSWHHEHRFPDFRNILYCGLIVFVIICRNQGRVTLRVPKLFKLVNFWPIYYNSYYYYYYTRSTASFPEQPVCRKPVLER